MALSRVEVVGIDLGRWRERLSSGINSLLDCNCCGLYNSSRKGFA